MPSGIIIKGIAGFYYVKTQNGIYECKAKGVFRKDDLIPLPGDYVRISIIDESKKNGNVDEILPRKNKLIRPAVANITQIAIVVSVKSPSTDYMLMDKLLITAEQKDIKPFVCINKVDLCKDNEHQTMMKMINSSGYDVVLLSSVENVGFEELAKRLQNNTTVFAGQSGVGKSTILNNIMDANVMETGDISGKIERGKHTTRHAQLIELKHGGFMLDTPGFSSFTLQDIPYDELALCYPEFREYINSCRFTGCSHITEPGCSIKDALEQGHIHEDRYKRYVQLYQMMKEESRRRYS